MISIRVFLVTVILAVIVLFNFVATLRGYQSSMQEADRLFDKQLLDTARLIANIHTENTPVYVNQGSDLAFQVWQEGKLMAASSNAPATAIGPFVPGFGYSNFDGLRWRTMTYFDVTWKHWVLVAERADLRSALAENVILESVFPVLLVLPVLGLMIWLIVTHGLSPLRKLADKLGGKQADDLSPIVMNAPWRELAIIVASSNGLLNRLENLLLREKQFASDAAHELRTPISALKVQLYNLNEQLPGHSGEIGELEHTAERLAHIVEQILALYRSSPDQYNAALIPTDLTALAQEVLAEGYPAFDRKNQSLEFAGVRCVIAGDRFALITLLQNLLGNASKYTPANGQIMVSVARRGQQVVLTVEDSGPGIAAEQHQAVFNRFYRIDGDRHQSGEPGCGLGLAIVKGIADLHHATIAITTSRFATGTALHIYFPAMDSQSGRA